MRENPGWFSLIARAAAPQALLPFRYTDGTLLMTLQTLQRLAVDGNKVMAGGTPANPAALGI